MFAKLVNTIAATVFDGTTICADRREGRGMVRAEQANHPPSFAGGLSKT